MKNRGESGKQTGFTAKNGKSGKTVLYLLQLLLCLVPQAITVILLLADAGSQFAYDLCFVLLPFATVPLLALVTPFFCSKRGVHPLLTFFPAGLFMLVNPVYTASVYRFVAIGCIVASLISACAGEEAAKRSAKAKKTKK